MNPFVVRTIAAVILCICAVVVLGISAHVENEGRSLGLSSSTFTYDAFVGAFVLVAETGYAVYRAVRSPGLASELGLELVLWVFWLASGISTTVFTEQGVSVCRHLDDLFDLPGFENVDQNALAAAKKILQSACSELHAELAFIWIGFVVSTSVVGYTAVLVLRQRARGNKEILKTSYKQYDVAAHSSVDPFADPVGARAGPSVGVARPAVDEEPDHKSPTL